MPRTGRRAVFLDRDGVVIEEVHYLRDSKDLRLIPGAARSLARLNAAGLRAIVISNQSAVARGLLSAAGLRTLTRKLHGELAQRGARLDAVYYCPHHPRFGKRRRCLCRKPGIALVRAAARRFGLDLARSYFVGDTSTDIKTARNAGCVAILVRTGKAGADGRYRVRPDKTVADLATAVRWILSRESRERL